MPRSDPVSSPNPSPAPARAQVRLSAQVLTCLVLCLVAAPIIYFGGRRPLALFSTPFPPLWQLLAGQGLALLAAVLSYLLFRFTADSESTARTVQTYARLDLDGLNPVWIALCAAIGEEMLFRAALQPLLGLWIASLVFLVVHTPVYRFRHLDRATLVQAAGVFGAGLVLGLVFQYVGLLAAMLVHLWIDIVGLVVVRSVIRSRG
jgi:membrane protease YdiL (CAAX protease family)